MFMILMNALAWVVVIGLAVLAFGFAGAAIGAVVGNALAGLSRLFRSMPNGVVRRNGSKRQAVNGLPD